MKVAIQGISGSYHEVAAKNHLGKEVTIVACKTFKDVFDSVTKKESDLGIVAIENTIAGTLRPNHILLQSSSLKIVGEYKLRIEHCICALPGETLDSITEVHSHPIALMQCEDFLDRHPHLTVVEKDDTASSARRIASQNLKGCAAICSEYAAHLYGLQILQKGIETNKRNFTRFLILQREQEVPQSRLINKASIAFSLPHKAGSLSQTLSILSFYGINLTKIESLPIIGKEWEYQFHIDLTFDDAERYNQAINAILPLTSELQELGTYKEF